VVQACARANRIVSFDWSMYDQGHVV